MVGSISSGILSDVVFYQRRDVTSLVFTLLMIPAFFLIQFVSSLNSFDNSSSNDINSSNNETNWMVNMNIVIYLSNSLD